VNEIIEQHRKNKVIPKNKNNYEKIAQKRKNKNKNNELRLLSNREEFTKKIFICFTSNK